MFQDKINKMLYTLIILLVFSCSTQGKENNKSSSWNLDLNFHEELGGHVISRHVGKSAGYLKNRLKQQKHISGASSFHDLKSAQYAIDKGIKYNSKKIKQWLKSNDKRLTIIYKGKKEIGIGFKRNSNKQYNYTKAKIILQKHKKAPFFILTAYPF